MRLLIMSTEKQFEIDRIKEEAEALGHSVEVKKPCDIKKAELEKYSCLLIRAIKGESVEAKEIARNALNKGLVVVDEKIALGLGRNKYQNYLLFKKNDLFVPKTLMLDKKNLEKIDEFEGEGVVVKNVSGKRGQDLYKVRKIELDKLIKKLDKKQKYMVQEFVPIEKELRVLVVGEKVLGAFYKETADWKHNISLGAKPKQIELDEEVKKTALKATKIVGTEIAGVDIAYTPKGLFVLEVNRSPGFKGFEEATGANVAREIVNYLEMK